MDASFGKEFDQFKLSVTVEDGYFVHETPHESGILRTERWRRDGILGHGSFGDVFKERREDGELRVVKRVRAGDLRYVARELAALAKLKERSEYFVEFRNWFEYDWAICFVMNYFEHGNLARFTTKKKHMRLVEEHTIIITRQLVEGLVFMGTMDLCHRDLKPENILVASLHPISVKIADFGFARSIDDACTSRSSVTPRLGTPSYMAPEVLRYKPQRKYGKPVDYWSLGCLIHAIITGVTPFEADYDTLDEYCNAGDDNKFPLKKLNESHASNEAINFITNLMKLNPDARLKPQDATRHPWLVSGMQTSRTYPTPATSNDIPFDNHAVPGTLHECNTLQCAVTHGSRDDLDQLLRVGAEIMVVDSMETLKLAAIRGYSDVVELLINEPGNAGILVADLGHGWTALHIAAYNGHLELVNKLLNKGAEIAAVDGLSNTALHKAAHSGHVGIVGELLDWGADIEAVGGGGNTALHMATVREHLEVVRLLLDRGANINVTNLDGWTTLHTAAYNGYLEIVKELLDWQADITATTGTGNTSLHLAVEKGYRELVILLLERGAEIGVKSVYGWAALHIAVYNGHLGISEVLLDRQADITATAERGKTSLHLAAEIGHRELVTLLLDRGAGIQATDGDGDTALDYATSHGHSEVADILKCFVKY